MENVTVLILGGGRGKRLLPLTEQRCKPAVPVGGKYRLADIPISNCINSGVRRIYVLTQYRSASLNRHIARTYSFDNFSNGFVDVLAADQTLEGASWFQGAADAVRKNLNILEDQPTDDVVIMNGDILFRLDLRKLIHYHRTRSADVTLTVSPVAGDQAGRFGIAKIGRQTRLLAYHEKPDPAALGALASDTQAFRRFSVQNDEQPYLASIGVYVFRKSALLRLLKDESAVDFGADVIPRAVGECGVFAFLFDGYWRDLGTIRDFYEGNIDLARWKPSFTFYDSSAPIYTRSRFLPPSKMLNCQVDNSLISEGCLLQGARISESVIGLRSIVREGTEIVRTVLMGADYYDTYPDFIQPRNEHKLGVGPGCRLSGAIIDKNARIGRNCVIANDAGAKTADHELYVIRDGIVIVRKSAIIPDGTVI